MPALFTPTPFFPSDRGLRPEGLRPPRGVTPSGFRPLRKIPHSYGPQQWGIFRNGREPGGVPPLGGRRPRGDPPPGGRSKGAGARHGEAPLAASLARDPHSATHP